MLARKAGFVPYTENHTVVRRGHGWAKSSVKYRRWIVGIVIALVLATALEKSNVFKKLKKV